ncbi:DUF4153 domain-containing protein [bacterium]|nr:DUF4153 domain-containing protein [bacterium]
MPPFSSPRSRALATGILQGGAFYLLYWLITHRVAAFRQPTVFLPATTFVAFVPLALQLLAPLPPSWRKWAFTLAATSVLLATAFYTGWTTNSETFGAINALSRALTFGLRIAIGWFLALCLMQDWIETGSRKHPYASFLHALGHHAYVIGSSVLFVGIVWSLLGIGSGLFTVIGLQLVADMFFDPLFFFPFTTTLFAWSIHHRQTRGFTPQKLRQQVSFYAWLTPLASGIALLFLASLPFTGLEPLWGTGHATSLMLALQVATLALTSLTVQDGSHEPPFSPRLRGLITLSLFAMPLYAILCAYSLGLRIQQYGWSVSRVWAALLVATIGLWGVGYALAPLKRHDRWLALVPALNKAFATLIVLIAILVNTPLLDAERIAVASQVNRLLEGTAAIKDFDFAYLKSHSGKYGHDAYQRLASLTAHPQAAVIKGAIEALQDKPKVAIAPLNSTAELLVRTEVYPRGKALDATLAAYLFERYREGASEVSCYRTTPSCLMVAIDLNGDRTEEFVLLEDAFHVFSRTPKGWTNVGQLQNETWGDLTRAALRRRLQNAPPRAIPAKWHNLSLGELEFRVRPRYPSPAAATPSSQAAAYPD